MTSCFPPESCDTTKVPPSGGFSLVQALLPLECGPAFSLFKKKAASLRKQPCIHVRYPSLLTLSGKFPGNMYEMLFAFAVKRGNEADDTDQITIRLLGQLF